VTQTEGTDVSLLHMAQGRTRGKVSHHTLAVAHWHASALKDIYSDYECEYAATLSPNDNHFPEVVASY